MASLDVKDTSKSTAVEKPPKPEYYRVVTSLDTNRVLFRSVSEKRTEGWLMARAPRGSDLCMQLPDGTYKAYEQERSGPYGTDVDQWQPFDPDEYQRPELASALAPDEWADVEV